jgi:hypothetical protein
MKKYFLFLAITSSLILANDIQKLKSAADVSIFTNVDTKELDIQMPKKFKKVILKTPITCEDIGFPKDALAFEDTGAFNEVSKEYIDNANKRYCKHTDYTKSDVAGKENLAYYSN